VFYEAPTRLALLLDDLTRVAGDERQIVVARELTKLHEEFRTGTPRELAGYYATHAVRGEVTVVLQGGAPRPPAPPDEAAMRHEAERLLGEGISRRDAARRLMDAFAISRNAAYRLVSGA
jgi:16S rRNA (cytidine1402-2'-O)-methyltransferase